MKNKKNLLAASVLVLSAIFGMIPFAQEPDSEALLPSWEANVLKEEHGAQGDLAEDGIVKDPVETAFGVQSWKRKDIRGVYVLDTLEEMPADAVDLSESGNGSVMGWLDAEDNLYIAGEGGVKAPKDASGLFAWYQNAQVIDPGGNLHTEDTTDFRYMFYHNYKAQKINLTGMDTGKAETFSKMFAYCESITQLDFSSFETSCCRSFYQMFIQCISLKKLDLTTFNPVSAYTMALMFHSCKNLEEILFSPERFDTSNVQRMTDLFICCTKLSSLDVSWFDMGEVRSVTNMFMGCSSLPYMNLTKWDLKNVEEHDGMFAHSSLEVNYGQNGEYFFDEDIRRLY